MTYIRKLLFICCSVFFSGSVYAECFDTPAELKAQDIVEMRCISQEKNLELDLYTTVRGDVYIKVSQIPTPSCDMRHNATTAPSKSLMKKSSVLPAFVENIVMQKHIHIDMMFQLQKLVLITSRSNY
ncbi:hypothetical protein JHX32_19520 [Escherichia coli]|uniref:hypothetical protein n=1 Tax=Escherichia coli TaxID=562 RepID=UPI001BD58D72|nr:hypothetical protein [Escherichia coli]MBS9709555.1 hypothetical protein [Escherichia coli]